MEDQKEVKKLFHNIEIFSYMALLPELVLAPADYNFLLRPYIAFRAIVSFISYKLQNRQGLDEGDKWNG